MKEEDAKTASELHRKHIRGAALPLLGERFLTAFYREMIKNPDCALLGWEEAGELLGFICCCKKPDNLMASIILPLMPSALSGFFRLLFSNPLMGVSLFRTLSHGALAGKVRADGELLFIALDGKIRRQGISDLLVAESLKWLKDSGASRVMVSTAGNNAGASALLERADFRIDREYLFRGEKTKLYLKEI